MIWDDFYRELQGTYHTEDESTVIKVALSDIVDMSDGVLQYKNGIGETIRVDLDQCSENFYAAQGVSLKQDAGRLKGIGGRFFPYFEIFTLPHHTRIYLPLKQTAWTRFLQKLRLDPYRKQHTEFYAFQRKLNAMGYTSLDLS